MWLSVAVICKYCNCRCISYATIYNSTIILHTIALRYNHISWRRASCNGSALAEHSIIILRETTVALLLAGRSQASVSETRARSPLEIIYPGVRARNRRGTRTAKKLYDFVDTARPNGWTTSQTDLQRPRRTRRVARRDKFAREPRGALLSAARCQTIVGNE